MLKKILVVVLALFSSSQLATSQVATGAIITGTVTDSAQAVLPKAVVTVIEISTGVVTKTNTNGNGQYRTPPLGIGEYTIEVESAGFKLFPFGAFVSTLGQSSKSTSL
ncbi:carboxypeptidase-like regulatory domain-containing protein [Tunturiibacter empetritectus]|uniref:carboxypeptidase-like regulatory domain-containing protein n=1 Tax=Tunturiibacter empetritectus TaxID=3069691 RepID=UPI003D9ADA87